MKKNETTTYRGMKSIPDRKKRPKVKGERTKESGLRRRRKIKGFSRIIQPGAFKVQIWNEYGKAKPRGLFT